GDYGIHMLSRYIEERRRGRDILESIIIIQKSTGVATISSALTTIATFYALMFTHFKGLSQFGAIAGTGVLFCFIIIFTAFPAILVVTERIFSMKLKALHENEKETVARPSRRGLVASVILTVVHLVAMTYGASSIRGLEFEYDFRKLGSDNPELQEFNAKRSGSLRGLTISPAVALANNPEQGKMLSKDLKGKNLKSVELVASIFDIIPENQPEKLKIIGGIKDQIDKKRDFVENEDDRKRVDELYGYTEVGEITLSNVPNEYLRFFREESGKNLGDTGETAGNVVYIFPLKDLSDGHNCLEFFGDYTLNGEHLPVSGSALVMADVLKMIEVDGPHAIGIAFFTVFFIVIMDFAMTLGGRVIFVFINHLFFLIFGLILAKYQIFFGSLWEALFITTGASLAVDIFIDRKNLLRTVLVLSPVTGGLFLTLGAMYLLDLKINLFNMVVLPTMIGIGVDNGLHIYHRYKEEGAGSIAFVLKHTGPPIFMASLTTVIGFTGVLI
ncbi:MAG: MMPL family transporter, partial [Deltaproteobacteria bacterium]|nr:MMPL family transporter [Deltaproteobacteria bacterium]